ncbi:hypothetical protein [Peribacillus frigoritolerans]|uniref:S-layer homology domain-containing protein n=1 Tax=Peribacillus castrilensis TaxID=2897690 RepID=A0AAW9NQX5_9BACI|nr:hypothetical protein [Peribacillus castrilensis]
MRLLDVPVGHKYYDDIMEAYTTILDDGEPLLDTLPYQYYVKDKPYIYAEITSKKNQLTYVIKGKTFKPDNEDNPLQVTVDGIPWGYKSTKIVKKDTQVVLHIAPKEGSIVSFISPGVPSIGSDERPKKPGEIWYPRHELTHSDQYVWWPNVVGREYVTVFGERLKRIQMDPDDWDTKKSGPYDKGKYAFHSPYDEALATKYIGNKTDVYLITASGRIYLPWNLEGVTVKITYAYNTKGRSAPKSSRYVKNHTETFKAWAGSGSGGIMAARNDRFFPDAAITRAEMVIAIARLREHFQVRYTDTAFEQSEDWVIQDNITAYQGQTVFRLNGTYPSGKGKLIVKKNRTPNVYNPKSSERLRLNRDYRETNDHTITLLKPAEEDYVYEFWYSKKYGELYYDLGRNVKYYDTGTKKLRSVNGTTAPWVDYMMKLENEKLLDGSRLIGGSKITSWHNKSKTQPRVTNFDHPVAGKDKAYKYFFMPNNRVDRLEVAGMLNRFRLWCIERFK